MDDETAETSPRDETNLPPSPRVVLGSCSTSVREGAVTQNLRAGGGFDAVVATEASAPMVAALRRRSFDRRRVDARGGRESAARTAGSTRPRGRLRRRRPDERPRPVRRAVHAPRRSPQARETRDGAPRAGRRDPVPAVRGARRRRAAEERAAPQRWRVEGGSTRCTNGCSSRAGSRRRGSRGCRTYAREIRGTGVHPRRRRRCERRTGRARTDGGGERGNGGGEERENGRQARRDEPRDDVNARRSGNTTFLFSFTIIALSRARLLYL